jgi:hypothetical protein
MITCKACHRTFKTLNNTHLKMHDLIPEEYKKKYRVKYVHSRHARRKISKVHIGNKYNKGRKCPPKVRKLSRKRMKALWKDKAFNFKRKVLKGRKRVWNDKEYRRKHSEGLKLQWSNPQFKAKMSKILSKTATKAWKKPGLKAKRAKISRKLWENPDYRARVLTNKPK